MGKIERGIELSTRDARKILTSLLAYDKLVNVLKIVA